MCEMFVVIILVIIMLCIDLFIVHNILFILE
jgi:hypothetical protein